MRWEHFRVRSSGSLTTDFSIATSLAATAWGQCKAIGIRRLKGAISVDGRNEFRDWEIRIGISAQLENGLMLYTGPIGERMGVAIERDIGGWVCKIVLIRQKEGGLGVKVSLSGQS
jgi:hypothetical protein